MLVTFKGLFWCIYMTCHVTNVTTMNSDLAQVTYRMYHSHRKYLSQNKQYVDQQRTLVFLCVAAVRYSFYSQPASHQEVQVVMTNTSLSNYRFSDYNFCSLMIVYYRRSAQYEQYQI